ncbi:hypothetical protein ACEZDB_27725 [Streptacidiphilus sp. N1-3]|uniref:Uncharacterized protein n=1 Tax=Streptacidiphilus alkalitolerans TaxID=3342712 RepID=A0ABV6X832_9ACTN
MPSRLETPITAVVATQTLARVIGMIIYVRVVPASCPAADDRTLQATESVGALLDGGQHPLR